MRALRTSPRHDERATFWGAEPRGRQRSGWNRLLAGDFHKPLVALLVLTSILLVLVTVLT